MNDQPTTPSPNATNPRTAAPLRDAASPPKLVTPLSLAFAFALLSTGFLFGYLGRGSSAGVETAAPVPPPAPVKYTKPAAPPLAKRPESQPFMRLQSDQTGKPVALESAVVSYVPLDGSDLKVTLVGAVHIADADYFDRLNELFRHFDIVLYELVAPQGTVPQYTGIRSKHPIAKLQYLLLDILGLHHQLEGVHYTAPNFAHADLSFDELIKLGQERGETALTFGAGVVLDVLRMVHRMEMRQQQGQAVVAQPTLSQLLDEPEQVREIFARSLVDEGSADLLTGLTTLAPYLIEARNAAALRGLDAAIAQGKTNIAIYYGAAHLPDFERRLFEEFGLVRQEGQWLRAWDLTKPMEHKDPFTLLMKVLRD